MFLKTVPNILSFSRIPLSFLLFSENESIRLLSVALAILTDVADGFLARKFNVSSHFGTLLDPIADKIFFSMGIISFLMRGELSIFFAGLMFARDFALALFFLRLYFTGRWASFKIQAINWGKIATSLQMIVFLALILGIPVSPIVFYSFIGIGFGAYFELNEIAKKTILSHKF